MRRRRRRRQLKEHELRKVDCDCFIRQPGDEPSCEASSLVWTDTCIRASMRSRIDELVNWCIQRSDDPRIELDGRARDWLKNHRGVCLKVWANFHRQRTLDTRMMRIWDLWATRHLHPIYTWSLWVQNPEELSCRASKDETHLSAHRHFRRLLHKKMQKL